MNLRQLPDSQSLRSIASNLDEAGQRWQNSTQTLAQSIKSGDSHLGGRLQSSFSTAADPLIAQANDAAPAYHAVADHLRLFANYVDSVRPEYLRLINEIEIRQSHSPFGSPYSLNMGIIPAIDSPEHKLDLLVSNLRAYSDNVADLVMRQANRAREAASAIDSKNTEDAAWGIITVLGTVVSLVLPEALLAYAPDAVAATAAGRLGATARMAAAVESSTAIAARAIASEGVATIIGDTGLPISSAISRGAYTYYTNGVGQVVRVTGKLELGAGQTVNRATATAVRELGNPQTDQAGHLIGKIFRGPNDQVNLVPQDANLNQGAWRTMEKGWATALRDGKEVKVDIRVNYKLGETRPSSYSVRSTTGNRIFANSPGGQF